MSRGRVRSWSDDALTAAVASSDSLTEVLRTLGLRPAGGNHASVRAHVVRLDLDTSHFTGTHRTPGVLAFHRARRLDLANVFCLGSRANRTTLRLRAREHVRPYRCAGCGNPGAHQGRPLALQLDHANGIGDDNRLPNLRWLCPNCHSQTDTFCGRSKGRIASNPAPRERTPVL